MTTTTIKRYSAGEYDVSEGGRTVHISRFYWLPRSGGQWVAKADWDRHLYTDPLPTYADAKAQAMMMLRDAS